MARNQLRIAVWTVILSAWTLQSAYADGAATPVIPADGYPGGTVPADQITGYGYPYLNAPLYPSPQPNVPVQVGSSVYTNQAFAPHEMLYPHTYRAMYPPFYFHVRGKWMVTPWGVWSHDHWVLQGTKVQVKYRSQKPMLSLFCPPVVR
jgi:hypothetical protein